MAGTRLIPTLVTIILFVGVAFVGIGTINAIDEGADGATDSYRQSTVPLDGTQWVEVDDGDAAGTNETVVNSRGVALSFTGADDSALKSKRDVDVSNSGNWTVSQPVLELRDTNNTQTILAIGDPNLYIQYLPAGAGNWSAVYVTTTNSYRVNVSAPSPENTSFVTVVKDGSTLTIYRDGTPGENVTTTSEHAIGGNLTAAEHADVTLDETRMWGEALSSSQRTAFRDHPVRPVANVQRSLRIIYDQRDADSIQLWFTGTTATATNVTYVDGFNGEVMDEKDNAMDLIGGNDYRWRTTGPEIQPVDGGRLDGAPVAFVDYTRKGGEYGIREGYTSVFNLADIIPLLLMAGVLFAALRGFNRRA